MVGLRSLREFPVGFIDNKSHSPSAIPVPFQLLEISVNMNKFTYIRCYAATILQAVFRSRRARLC